jgi:hypothetical protein
VNAWYNECDLHATKGTVLPRTWTEILAQHPQARKIQGGNVFKLKQNEDGEPERYKGRYFAKEYKGAYNTADTKAMYHSPVATAETIRLITSEAIKHGNQLISGDVTGAYLNAPLATPAFITPCDGWTQWAHTVRPHDTAAITKMKADFRQAETRARSQGCPIIFEAVKAIPGLREAGRAWNQEIHRTLIGMGFQRAYSESCVYFRKGAQGLDVIILYVDDLIFSGKNPRSTLRELQQHYDITDGGKLKWFLGVKWTWDKGDTGVTLTQTAFIDNMVEKFAEWGVDTLITRRPQWNQV